MLNISRGMLDWSGKNGHNQENIVLFIKELKEYFGSSLLIKKNKSRKMNFKVGEDIWKHEAGSSICRMIELSKLHYQESDFNNIVNNILHYYGKLE